MKSKKSRSSRSIWVISGGIALVFLCVGIVIAKLLITDDGEKRQRQIQMVTLMKPPPPPKIREEIPPPELKKEEVVELEEAPPDEMDDSSENDAPPGEDLGLDADGVAGSDAFGLKAKRGGRALIGSGSGSGNQYGWYTRMVCHEIEKRVNKILRGNGGVPDGDHKTVVKVELDDTGNIVSFSIVDSSGHDGVDHAVKEALEMASLSEPPPYGMPKRMQFRIMS
jgi:periplasmic protein TonB